MAKTANGKNSGRRVGPSFASDIAFGSIWPVKVIAEDAKTKPSNIEPESPMKMRAGCQLCGKKPMQTPMITAVIKDGAPAREKP